MTPVAPKPAKQPTPKQGSRDTQKETAADPAVAMAPALGFECDEVHLNGIELDVTVPDPKGAATNLNLGVELEANELSFDPRAKTATPSSTFSVIAPRLGFWFPPVTPSSSLKWRPCSPQV